MTIERIIERLKKIVSEIESDNYTRENLERLIEDVETSINIPF